MVVVRQAMPAGMVAAPPGSEVALAALGQLAEKASEAGKKMLLPSAPSFSVASLFWTAAKAAGGFAVGAHMGHPVIGAIIGGFAPAPIVMLSLMGAYFNARED